MSFRTAKPCPTHNILCYTDLYLPSLLLSASVILPVARRPPPPRVTPPHVRSDTYSPPSAGLTPQQVTIEGFNSGLLTPKPGGQYLSISHKAKLFAWLAGHEKTLSCLSFCLHRDPLVCVGSALLALSWRSCLPLSDSW